MKHEGPFWNVLNVQTGQELPAAKRIEDECGAEVYCPSYEAQTGARRGRLGREIVEKAALPSYIMVREDTIDDVRLIHEDPRVRYFVQFDEFLATVCQCVIDEMQSRQLLGAFEPRFISGPVFVVGETIKVPDGPYKSYRGQVIAGPVRGSYCLDNIDFTRPVWFEGLKLLQQSV